MEKAELKENIREATFENKISREVAEELFQKLVDFYDVVPEEFGDKDYEKNFERIKRRFVRAMMDGKLAITEEKGRPYITQRLTLPPAGVANSLKYKPMSGKSRVAMKGHEDDDNHGRMQALCGELTGEGEAAMRSLEGGDLSLMEYIGSFFLQV